MVSIHGPLGYGPSTLPLRHSAISIGSVVLKATIGEKLRKKKTLLSEVGFEPTPTEVDCDLNAAP